MDYEDCLAEYGLTKAEAAVFKENGIDKAETIAEAGIPVLLIAGDADVVVPFDENGEIFAKRFRDAGGKIKIIVKPGCGHHPHSLDDPEPIVNFIKENYNKDI